MSAIFFGGRRKSVAVPALLLLLAFSAVAQQPGAAPAAPAPAYVVTVPVANMYSGPSEDTDVVSQAIYASNVGMVEEKGEWIKVRTSDDYLGWVKASAMKKLNGAPYAESGPAVQVNGLSANIYREQSVTKHAPMVTAPFDSKLAAKSIPTDPNARWINVVLPDGREGWVQTGDVAMSSSAKKLTVPETIDLARKFLGVTYTWGGTSSFGYDCSGFMQMLMKHRGYIMPRDAGPQAGWSNLVPVERKDLQAGDLLYFGSAPDKITHTGMYIGDGMFIHDTTNSHPQVQISKLDDQPWTRILVAQRRLK